MPNYININHLSETDWKNASAETYVDFHNVAIWRITVSALISNLEELQSLLTSQETEKVMRYKHQPDRNQRIISKAVLRVLLGRYTGINAKEIHFQPDKNKKPYIENTTSGSIHFNVSHSGNYVLIAIAATSVGIDVEQLNASFTYQNVLSFGFSKPEIDFVENSANPNQSFYQLWTRKECLLKATGKGLVDDLTQIPSLDGWYQIPVEILESAENWHVSSFKVDENHVGSIAFYPIKTALQFFNFQL